MQTDPPSCLHPAPTDPYPPTAFTPPHLPHLTPLPTPRPRCVRLTRTFQMRWRWTNLSMPTLRMSGPTSATTSSVLIDARWRTTRCGGGRSGGQGWGAEQERRGWEGGGGLPGGGVKGKRRTKRCGEAEWVDEGGGRKRQGNGGGWEDGGRWGRRTVFREGQGGGARGEGELRSKLNCSTFF